jgi:hypothetical protein
MDKVGSEGDEARAMMREIRTLSLQPAGSTMSAMSATIRTGDAPMSAIGTKFRSQLHTTFSQQPQSNSTYTYRGTVSSSIDDSSYRDGSGSGSRSLFEEKDSANESKSNFLDLERSLDDSHYDARRAEGDLSMSIGSSEEEDVDLGPRHANYRTP